MVEAHMKYLAEAIVTENQIVTYRLLSRALKVHHNVSKRMLYDFHQKQNSKKAGSIHATYLISGIQVLASEPQRASNEDEDIPMPSSPYMSSPAVQESQVEAEPVRQKVLTLAKEENLDVAKAKYDSISSIHIYSLEPSALQNLEALSAVTQQIVADYITEDPLLNNKTYGVIQNPHVKRRSGARPVPAPLPVKQETKSAFAKSNDPKTAGENRALLKPHEAPPGSGEQATKIGAPALLKRESSDLFKSFAKTKPKLAKSETKSSKASDDVPMKDVSSEDEEDGVDPLVESTGESSERRKLRLEQQEKLRKMMEESDEDEPTSEAKDSKAESEAEAEPEAEEEESPSAPIDAPASQLKDEKEEAEEEEQQPADTVSGGRRRGRRKVMKKKTTRDAEGYLVTKEEPVWESFSEDDVPLSSKSKVASSAASNKGKKAPPGKPGQGNIMSFFGKK